MFPPDGYTKAKPGQVCLLQRSLYGLKQASREWNSEFCTTFLAYGFTQSSHDHCLFIKVTNDHFLALLVYVDDVLVTGSHTEDIQHLKSHLDDLFTIKDLGFSKYFLGVELARSSQGTYLHQRKYILDIIADTGTPLTDPNHYRRLIGRLMYLNFTRPDLTFAVQQLSQFVNSPDSSHWDAALHVVRYLKGCPSTGLFYPSQSHTQLMAYSDADWGTCPDTRKSLTGYCVFLGGALISWKTKKQNTVSRSSAETEYRALTATVCELQWISYIARDLQRTKHLDIDCHIVRNQFKDGFILLRHVSTKHQLADIFTKSLGGSSFYTLLSKLSLQDFHRGLT
ncbi:hypothetical protein DH2020_045902 [Rehmannia glutinosa]|uniref:Reverse transcriptase Ty1/copia-type domain-containing protein n=1 Tax=Rehmannia glutinosa TaxID=99300 RepID=A0ABR0UEI9_REHGL